VIGSGVTSIHASTFANVKNLKSIEVDENNSIYDSRGNSNSIIETATNKLIVGCENTIIPNSVTAIGANSFFGRNITSIVIPKTINAIGDMAMNIEKIYYEGTELERDSIDKRPFWNTLSNYAVIYNYKK